MKLDIRISDMVIRFFYVFLFIATISTNLQAQENFIRKSIFFHGGRYYITDDQLAELRHFIDSIPDIDNYMITIHSHTDNRGGVEFNEFLSRMRSESTAEELIYNNDIMPEAIEIKDFGQYNPVYDNNTEEGRQLNRRVDILFWQMSM